MKELKEKLRSLEADIAEKQAVCDSIREQLLDYEDLSYQEIWQDKLVQPNIEDYYMIHQNSGIPTVVKVNFDPANPSKRKPEHAFKTPAQAELMNQKLQLLQEMYAFAHSYNEGWEPNFSGLSHGLLIAGGKPTASSYSGDRNYFVFGIVVKTPEVAEAMLREFGNRLEEFYSKQY